MNRRLHMSVLALCCIIAASQAGSAAVSAQYDLGTSGMVIDAGVRQVDKPARSNTIYVDPTWVLTQPWILDQSDTEYVLMNDVTATATAFEIRSSNITLNLNGHTVTYLTQDSPVQTNGVFLNGYNLDDVSIVNGKIIQGNGTCLDDNGGNEHQSGNACNPIYTISTNNFEVGGLDITYQARDTSGIFLNWGWGTHIHHNTLRDLGNDVSNRMQGVDAVKGVNQGGVTADHNLIRRARQVGIRTGSGSEVYNNEVHIDSNATNSSGINVAGGSVHHNKVYGIGVHPIGIWPGTDIKVYSNYVDIESTRNGVEYESPGAACVRMTWSNDNVEVMYNTFILHESGNFKGRALWLGLLDPNQKAEFHDNIIIANNRDGLAKAAAIDVDCNNESPYLVFRNNKVISNWGNVVLSDEYGWGDGYAHFIDNTFIRQDNYPNYLTIRSQYSSFPSTAVFINNRFEHGASLRSMDLEFFGSGNKEIAIAWYLDITVQDKSNNPVSNARVVVNDRAGNVAFNGATDSQGHVRAEVTEYLFTNNASSGSVQNDYIPMNRNRQLVAGPPNVGDNRSPYQLKSGENIVVKTPHLITVSKNGKSVSKSLRVQKNHVLRFVL